MPPEELPTLVSTSGDPLPSVQRNPFRSAEFLEGRVPPPGRSSAPNPFSLATPSLAQTPIAQGLGLPSSGQKDDNAYGPRSLSMTASGTDTSNTPFAGAKGLATSSSWTGTQRGRDDDNGRVHQQPVVNIARAGNVLGTNYGHVTQTIEEFNISHNIPVHPDINSHVSDCFPGSRSGDEAHILEWINTNHAPELVLCVLGKVGVGKSTLAKRLATRLRRDKRLAAEVFLGFALPDWTPESVIRMAASQLCRNYPTLRRAVSEALDLDVGPSVSLEDRVQKLILEPIRSLGLDRPVVVVLDALDQWAPHPIFIKALACLATEAHLIRFIVLGRPGLEDRFLNVSFTIYSLPAVSKSILKNYFSKRFNQVRWEYGRRPSSQTIDRLVDKADGLFIWSSTLCSLIEDRQSCPNPHDTLTAVLQSQQSIGDDDILAKLYHGAINTRFPKPDHKAKLAVFLGAVMVLQEPLPTPAFASMVLMGVYAVQNILADLGALQAGQRESNQGLVLPAASMFHLSFLEYLQSLETPAHLAFPIDTFTSHSELGKACLQEMRRVVHSPQSTSISPLQKYAMRYWPIHTAHGTPTVSPTSDIEWKTTPHFGILNSLSDTEWQHWATLYIRLFHPGADQLEDEVVEDSTQPQPVHPKGAKRRSPRRAIQALWRKLSQKPAQDALGTLTDGTSRHSISRVTELLLQGPLTEGTLDAIAVAEVAVRLQHQSSHAWLELGTVYRNAALINPSGSVLDSAICACRFAAEAGGYEVYPVQEMLAICLSERFNFLGLEGDLDEAILLERAVLLLTPPGHPDRSSSLNHLASSLQSDFEVTGSAASLEESIILNQEALSLRPPGHPDRPSSLITLANSLQAHFEVTGSTASLEEAIVLLREALLLWPPGHPDRSLSLNNLANSLQSRFEGVGSTVSLEEAIVLNREALSLRPLGHPFHPSSLINLANSLQSHFEVTGSTESLNDSVMLGQEALSLRPPGHPLRPWSLHILSKSLQSHFDQSGSTEVLDKAIALNRETLLVWIPGHPYRPQALESLAKSLHSHHNVTASFESLDEAIALGREALSLWPSSHPLRSFALSTLAISLDSHFALTGIRNSLDEAIPLHREAVSVLPTNHPMRALRLTSLANSLQVSYKSTGNIEHLNEAKALIPSSYETQ